MKRKADTAPGTRTGLVRVTGAIVVALSALSQEYGSGINFVVPHGLGRYPGVDNLVPLAILVAGLLLIPQVALFSRFSRIMPNAGSSYVWLTRTLGATPGFAVAFIWFIGLCGAMGFVAYVVATFLHNTFLSFGVAVPWLQSAAGHLVVGLVSIWTLAVLHCTGVKRYGYFVYVVGTLVFVAASIIVFTGFTTAPHVFLAKLSALSGVKPHPVVAHPAPQSFFAVVALFIFAYGGLSGGASLAGETANPTHSMPRGIIGGWALALILYTLVAYSLFHAVPWWSAKAALKGGHGYLLTVPSLIGLLVSTPVAIFLNVLISAIVIKTLAPQILSASRFLYAWAEDGFITRTMQSTNRTHAPAAAIIVAAVIGSLFLVDAVFSGWAIGVAVRSESLILTFMMLGIGVLRLSVSPEQRRARYFGQALTSGWFIKAIAVAAVLIGLPLMILVSYTAGHAWYLEPWAQVLIAIAVAIILSVYAHLRHRRENLGKFHLKFLRIPEE